MERGLLWLPLLGLFSWLAWAGWNEYRKLEAYKIWAIDFERAKYDIYAALGQAADRIVWGYPTRNGPQKIQQVSLKSVKTITLYTGKENLPAHQTLPKGCQVCLGLACQAGEVRLIPFTDFELASRWQKTLQTLLESLQSTPNP
ncbi:MAG: hypothetical protein F6K42_00065 [Leptolyngbya sp. SIO1D8]|nr:hypothetical protein [Leptolyngbya sp. SIO1D8]